MEDVMKASELIKELQQAMEIYGDLPVNYYNGSGDSATAEISVYDKEGNSDPHEENAVEIYIH